MINAHLISSIVCLSCERDFHGHAIIAFDSKSKILHKCDAGLIAPAYRRAFTEVFIFWTIPDEAEMLEFIFDDAKIGVEAVPRGCL